MSEQISEQISALLDGELPEAELSLLLRQVERQPSVLEQAYTVQQAHICSQGESPLSLTESINFSKRLGKAIRESDDTLSQTSTNSNILQDEGRVAFAGFNQQDKQADIASQALSNASFSSGQSASNDSRWRPLLGAGIAAAVALVAVNAWQFQGQNTDGLGPSNFEVDNKENASFETPVQTQAIASTFKSKNNKLQQDNGSYTVPNFDNLNINSSIIPGNDFREVGYSDYLLQNNIAPQSTSKQLSRFAQEQRAIIYQEQIYIDPRSGQIILSIKPIIE